MFERTLNFWRRWVGAAPEGNTATAVAPDAVAPDAVAPDERRFWVRYPADLKTSVQLSRPDGPFSATAELRDISRGGVNFILDRPLPTGRMVNLELPLGRGEVHTILACVVRATEEAEDRWALGCLFSRELTDADLSSYGVRRVRHDDPGDQRAWMRFNCNLTARFQKIASVDAPVEGATVLNLSASGIGLLVDSFVDAGTLLNIDLTGRDSGATRTILACVVHVNQQGEAWALGCNFIRELTDEDIQALI